jgi:hypothetical protein
MVGTLHEQRKRIRRVWSCCTPRRLLVAAAVFHVLVALTVFGLGRSNVMPQQFHPTGIGQFANDGFIYVVQADALAQELVHQGPRAWFKEPAQLHVKLFSLSYVALRPIFGANILTIEPLNLVYYLAILLLVYKLASTFLNGRSAMLPTALVAVWPTLLLHTTQFLREPLFIAGMLGLTLVLSKFLTVEYKWRRALLLTLLGVVFATLLWLTRSDVAPLVRGSFVVATVFLVIKMRLERRLLTVNLAALLLLTTLIAGTSFIRPPRQLTKGPEADVPPPIKNSGQPSSFWDSIAKKRRGFISQTRSFPSTIDADVQFSSAGDVLRYVPRAAEIGCFAPFPRMWFNSGYTTGKGGRILAGLETVITYVLEIGALIELLASFFVLDRVRRFAVWLIFMMASVGVTALAMVVVNIGTLYRMRYAFWVLLAVLGVTGWLRLASVRNKVFRDVTARPAAETEIAPTYAAS